MCQRERLNLNSVIMVKPKEYAKFLIRDKELIKESVNLKRSTSTEPSIARHPSRKDPD